MIAHALGEGFHLERLPDGGVRLVQIDGADEDTRWVSASVTLTAGQWAAAVAAVSARGDVPEAIEEALALHEWQPPPAA